MSNSEFFSIFSSELRWKWKRKTKRLWTKFDYVFFVFWWTFQLIIKLVNYHKKRMATFFEICWSGNRDELMKQFERIFSLRQSIKNPVICVKIYHNFQMETMKSINGAMRKLKWASKRRWRERETDCSYGRMRITC